MLHRNKHQEDDVPRSRDAPKSDQQRSGATGSSRRSSALRFFASSSPPKQETHAPSQKQWEASYLKDLRANRPPRPGGSRPLPERNNVSTKEPYARAASAMSFRPACSTQQPVLSGNIGHERSTSALSHRRAQSDMPGICTTNFTGESPLIQPSNKCRTPRDFSVTTASTDTSPTSPIPPLAYRENGLRWMEKQEARSLREALEDMDQREEAKVHAAAQNEASKLVWKHVNEGLPQTYAEPCRRYKEHLEKGANACSQSRGCSDLPRDFDRSVGSCQRSGSGYSISSSSDERTSTNTAVTSASSSAPGKGIDDTQAKTLRTHIKLDSPEKRAYTNLAFQPPPVKSDRRRLSGSRAQCSSGGLFRNPSDRIYEETDDERRDEPASNGGTSKIPTPLTAKARNTVGNLQSATQQFTPSQRVPDQRRDKIHRSEIYKNPPSQSRDPSYVENTLPVVSIETDKERLSPEDGDKPRTKDGLEVRSDDLRAATSMLMKDRSPRLPSPSVVSDRPGRTIVSFDKEWKPKDADKHDLVDGHQSPSGDDGVRVKPHMPTSTASAPAIPTLNTPDMTSILIDSPSNEVAVPTIAVSKAPIPTISLSNDHSTIPKALTDSRSTPAKRPLPHHSSTIPFHPSTRHWTPTNGRTTAQCAACALPISGRIVSAASQRFHPHCFTCHHCAEPLECVAFYPEPEAKRAERSARIEARLNGSDIPEDKPGERSADDADDSLRFYCHLDYHELFSPRCRSCKTPIESEVVVACGGSWHVGHFFCAECGDPFDPKTPFVEKDGYAWCVGCHAGRFSGKCKGCRKPVIERGVSALGAEWHEGCFVCVVCGGGFEDGRFFTKEDETKPVCVGCEEKRLKA
ncbi:MAG: hypothetical protein Q9217_003802 [Psora testacea]